MGQPNPGAAATLGGFGFAGEQADAESGLVYLRARHYDPATGRFLQEDPAGMAGSGPNLYAYVGGNPTGLTDPSGLCPVCAAAQGVLLAPPVLLGMALVAVGVTNQGGRVTMTKVEIRGEDFLIDGRLTYPGREYQGHRIEGLLLNSRMVQAIYDDLNPETRDRWAYPDTGRWDPERNVAEFLAMLPEYRRHGLLGVTVCLQGGSPEGYSKEQPWDNTAIDPDGELRPDYLDRLRRVLDRVDALGMVAIVSLFYFGQDERLRDEAAVRRGVENATTWLLRGGWENVILEINNECDVPRYEHEILQPQRVHELIELAKGIAHESRRLLVGTSFRGRSVATDNVVAVSDLILLHGNGVTDPNYIAEMVRGTRAQPSYRPMPIVFNEDDHFDFEQPNNNMLVALANGASWGYFDPGAGAGGAGARSNYSDGYQLVPVNWGINTARKQAFFRLVAEVTGA